jgi:hypothetical protein
LVEEGEAFLFVQHRYDHGKFQSCIPFVIHPAAGSHGRGKGVRAIIASRPTTVKVTVGQAFQPVAPRQAPPGSLGVFQILWLT